MDSFLCQISNKHGYQRDGEHGSIDVDEEEGLVVGLIGKDELKYGQLVLSTCMLGSYIRVLTLARKLDSVHRNTVINRKQMPSVLLATPARPKPSRKPTADAWPWLEEAVLAAPCEARLPRPSDEGIATLFLAPARSYRMVSCRVESCRVVPSIVYRPVAAPLS